MMSGKKIHKTAESNLPTKFGNFKISVYKNSDGLEHVVLKTGDLKETVLTRIHSQCFTSDTLLSMRCDCREQLQKSMELIGKNGSGVVLYLNQEGRGIGLTNKIKAYSLQDEGLDTVEANLSLGLPVDARDYQVVAAILEDLEIKSIKLLTNNPDKIEQLQKYGVVVSERVPIEIKSNPTNSFYLKTKKEKMGHQLFDL